MSTSWKQAERSNPLMLRLLLASARLLGRRLMGLVLWPVAAYYWVTHPEARQASRDLLSRCGEQRTGVARIMRHFHNFARVSVDRIFLLGGREGSVPLHTTFGPGARELLAADQGCLLVVAHFGSFEALRVPAVRGAARRIRIVLDRAVGRMALTMLEALDPGLAAQTIDAARPGPQVMLELREALQQGHLVGIMGDRARADERAVVVDFLGGRARLPAGPWLIAALLRVPVVLGFAVLDADGRYDCRFELFAATVDLPRATRDAALAGVAQRYAAMLEARVRAAPLNWFNFYDYWLDPARATKSATDDPQPAPGH